MGCRAPKDSIESVNRVMTRFERISERNGASHTGDQSPTLVCRLATATVAAGLFPLLATVVPSDAEHVRARRPSVRVR